MGDDYLILREDGYIRMNFPVTSLTYHSNLNIILVKTDLGGVHVLDVNSGVILQSSCLSADEGGALGIEYASGADRVFLWDNSAVGARTDYNGVLLLHTVLQRPLPSSQADNNVRLELVLSEAVLLYQCVQGLDTHSIEGLGDFLVELKRSIDVEPVRKGVKAQKWSTVTLSIPQSTLRLVMAGVVQELKGQNRRIPALAIASAVGQRANELMPSIRDEESRALMHSEAERKETFKRWPHMDYKWALPARMAQAGFYHQPSPSGDDRAMCFTCMVCLVCWEKSDDPWVEHERHSPNCPFVRGEYTHNVPISVTNATSCAVPCSNVCVVSKGNTGDMIATGTRDGKVNVWKFDCGLKLTKFIHLSPYDSIFSGILTTDCNKVWSTSLEKDTSTYGIKLTAMTFLGMNSQQEYNQGQNSDNSEKENTSTKTKPSLVCAVTITRTNSPLSDQPIQDDSRKALFDSGEPNNSKGSIEAMNDQNEAKNNVPCSNKMLFLLTYDIFSSLAGSITTVVQTSNSSGNSKPGGSKKVYTVQRTDDANIYDDIYFQFSDEDTELPQCTNNLLDETISNVINLNASSSKEDCKIWDSKKSVYTKHLKVLPSPPTALLPELVPDSGQPCMLDFVGKISQIKSWKSGHLESVGTKVVDQTDASQGDIPTFTQYLNMAGQGPLEISDLKWYEGSEVAEKVTVKFAGSKVGTQTAVSNMNNDGFESDPPQEDVVSQGIAVQCLSLPNNLNIDEDSRVTHILPTEDKEHLLIVISTIDPSLIKLVEESDLDSESKMEVDESSDFDPKSDRSDLDPKSDKSDQDPKSYRSYKPDHGHPKFYKSFKSENSDSQRLSQSYMLLYKINNKTSIYTLEDNPTSVKELPFNESPVDLCLLPINKENEYTFAAVGFDGNLRLYSLPDFNLLSEKNVPKGQFTSVVYCASVDRLSVSTKHGMIYFYALNNSEKDSTDDVNEDELANLDYDMLQLRDETPGSPPPVIIANKSYLSTSDLRSLMDLTGFYGLNSTVPYSAVVPGFWCELSPAQRSRFEHQNNRSWRLQNTSSTWDEHVLELTLPYSALLSHIEFSFILHAAGSVNLPIIQVTLLKQNLHGIGYKKDASFSHITELVTRLSESPDQYPVIEADLSNLENPVNSEEYLQAHNAEILAGPLLLSSGLDMTQQAGKLLLTSPRLYRARGRTFLIHIKTLFDPAKDMSKGSIKSGESSAKKSGFIGCDWLHQISITVWACPHTDVPLERQQRIAMLESKTFLQTLCDTAIGTSVIEKKKLALDLLNWVISVRLQRIRLAKVDQDKDAPTPMEAQQLECIQEITHYLPELIKNCILCGNRSIAKKCVKIILITSEGASQLPRPWKTDFDSALTNVLISCIPLVGVCDSPGALKWFMALYTTRATRGYNPDLVTCGTTLLEHVARCLRDRDDQYHQLLRARFGLYGLPLERNVFATDVPELGKGSSMAITYASVLSGEAASSPAPKQDYQLKDLLNLPLDECKGGTGGWWAGAGAAAACAGLAEALPLHVTCHLASDGTKLESATPRVPPPVVSAHPADTHQLWSVVKEGQLKESCRDGDSLDLESSMMDCDSEQKLEVNDEKLFKEQEHCNIPWAALVTRPPQHTLVVERMHSGARRYVVLDFGHRVRLTDVIIPMCSDLVTLCIDIWTVGEETDCVKLAFATDIATKHLVLTDLQPPAYARYMKITTIGRYGMSAMKCRIPLGWFFGEITEVANVQASVNALSALHQDLTCRFRLATGKLIDLLNPYLELYNGNAVHMMAYLNQGNDTDPKVITAYQECIELQSQLHNCTNILKKLQKTSTSNVKALEAVNCGVVTAEALLEKASTDKLRVIAENVIDMLLYYLYHNQLTNSESQDDDEEENSCGSGISEAWVRGVAALGVAAPARTAAGACTLLARAAAAQPWWGTLLADLLVGPFADRDAPPCPLDRCLAAVMFMARKSMYAHRGDSGGVAAALCERALQQLSEPSAQPPLLSALLTVLAGVLDAALDTARDARWDWVTGGRPKNVCSDGTTTPPPRTVECKVHRRKLHSKPLHKMPPEMDAWMEVAKRGIQACAEEEQRERLRASRATGGAARRRSADDSGRVLNPPLAAALAHALVAHILAMDATLHADQLLLAAKVIGRLCALCGSAALPDAGGVLGLARMAVRLPPWPRHALTALLQDLVEYENGEISTSPSEDWGGAGSSRVIRVGDTDIGFGKTPIKRPSPTVYLMTLGYPLSQVAESDDWRFDEKVAEHLAKAAKFSRTKTVVESNVSTVSSCTDARLESGAAAGGEALARRVLAASAAALPVALRASPLRPRAPPTPPDDAPVDTPDATTPLSPERTRQPPLAHTLYDVFRHLALEFDNQTDCTYIENVVSLWLTLNGSAWNGSSSSGTAAWSLGTPADAPRVRFATDSITALLRALVRIENVSLRCWVLSMQALAWIANLPLLKGSMQTMGRVILECEYFVPALVKFVSMDVSSDGSVVSSEPYLGGTMGGAGAGATAALGGVLARVVKARGEAGALATLRALAALWTRPAAPPSALDLHAALLRAAHALLPALAPAHLSHALPLIDAVAEQCAWWVREGGGGRAEGGSEARLSGLLADVLVPGGTRRAPLRRALLHQLLNYCRRLLAVPYTNRLSQTDESKAQNNAAEMEGTNLEDEKKQQAPKVPCLADTVLKRPNIMQKFYKALSFCDGMRLVLSPSGNGESSSVNWTLKEEVYWLVAQIPSVATNPVLMLTSLMEYLRKEEVVHLSQGMQNLIVRLFYKPEVLNAFLDAGGMELAVDKLTSCHQAGPSNKQGLVSSLMNHLKLPPQLINLSTPASTKKTQPSVVETTNGLVNIAPLCTVTCGNPTAQSADVLLGGGGACAARRVRAAAWTYHFYSSEDAALALTVTLPYAARLHEIQLQPHLTSLATCPGAVGVEAGCGGTVAPLGAPQSTAGMTSIRLVVAQPVVCNTVLLRLYRPRDSSNMGLLQLRLLVAPAFAPPDRHLPDSNSYTNRWARIVWTCTRARPERAVWATGGAGAAAVRALCACVVAGGPAAQHAHLALLAAARALPAARPQLLTALLSMDAHAHAHAFQSGSSSQWGGSVGAVCALAQALCRWGADGCARAYVSWLSAAAERWLRERRAPSAALIHTLAEVLWMLKAEWLLDNLQDLITDDLFELVYMWIKDVPETSLLKKALDAVLCSMCYIRPELFKLLMEQMEIPIVMDESMECLTDDTKVQQPAATAARSLDGFASRLHSWQLRSLAAASLSATATHTMLHSSLPAALVSAIADFSEAKLESILSQQNAQKLDKDATMCDSDAEDSESSMSEECPPAFADSVDLPSMKNACELVWWARLVCADRRLKDWLGGPGAIFWRPLLRLLCHPRPAESTWQEGALYSQLEENTIRLFAELTVCHPANQKLFASTLHSILESMPHTGAEGISGFTRALILRLVLSGERVTVALRWASTAGGSGAGAAGSAPAAPPASRHPAAACQDLLTLPVHTTVRAVLTDHCPPIPAMDESSQAGSTSPAAGAGVETGSGSVLRSASDTDIMTVAEAWELSLAAASASKDKRLKDVKNTTLKQQIKIKRQSKNNDAIALSVTDDLLESSIRVQVDGIDGYIPPQTTLAQILAAAPHEFGPHLTLNVHLDTSGEPWSGVTSSGVPPQDTNSGSAILRSFGACGGLALVAARLPRPHAAPAPPPPHHTHHDLDWVKLDDPYEEVVEVGTVGGGAAAGGSAAEEGCAGVPTHALLALALLLKLPGYAAALLDEGPRAVHLLRLLLGVAHDEDGRNIVASGGNGGSRQSLGTLPFRVVGALLEAAPLTSAEGRTLRRALLHLGAVRLVLACLAVFTHHKPTGQNNQNPNGGGKNEEKSQLYWAKGTGFGTGSTQQSWNVEQALVRQRIEEEHVTVLLQVLVSYMNPGEKWPPEEGTGEAGGVASDDGDDDETPLDLPREFVDLLATSSLVPAICSYLRNDSVLDMSRHIPLYVCVLRAVRALRALRCRRISTALRPLPRLLHSMSRTTNSYATKLRMSKKNIFGKMTYSQRFSTSSNSELSEEDEGLALLIADIQATSALMCRADGDVDGAGLPRSLQGASREARYIDLMRTMQFETFEMMTANAEGGFRFTVPYHFESAVRAAGERAHPARMKRLAQEAATLATSLPLSYSSSVFVRTDTDRLDVMKVLITGPSDTPYANGCFVLDVYFPAEYPAVPMLINLETTGRHSVRFNPNLYNDGKVCLSVLNTWHGRPEEKWNAHTSSFLQVLVSIQSLILVPEPYFNEPGYERSRGTRVGNSASTEYNSTIYQATVRWAMLDHLRSPEPCFKEVIQTHFWIKRNEIMQTVANWITELEGQTGDERTQRSIQLNLMALKRHYVKLQEELAKLPVPAGLEDLDEPFQLPAAPDAPPAAAAPPAGAPRTSDEIDHDMEKIVSQVLD
ncbi:baculoviral IAP repeat-containing protein 6 isoform X2 [Aricia agestis]|uniref:baculoviral IAP repeat-containing protein 6 isoform X2 n=1 Tax=Aricia agestis TaxID=91739 RepID=UPI001C2027A0|nr:baculoviral IAP repeat-containing protein 6 isoform X2 [Aricia agestis]